MKSPAEGCFTVYAWLRRYREHGSGLSNKPGRGRKPAFSETVGGLSGIGHGLVNRHKRVGRCGPWVRLVATRCLCLGVKSCQRLGIKSAPERPDKDYAPFRKQVLEEARENPETVVYQDEFSFYLQPTVAKDWTKTGTKYPLARQSYHPQET